MKKWLWLAVVALVVSGCKEGKSPAEMPAEESAKITVEAGVVVELTRSNFDGILADGVVLVDFWAPWCGPCRIQGAILDQVAKAVGADAVIGKVNVDEQEELAQRYTIRSIPTLIVFKDGELKQRLVGVHQEEDLVAIIQKVQ